MEGAPTDTRMDSQKFEQLVDDYSGKLFTHAFFRTSDREKAKDLVQETFLKAWKQVQGSGTPIENWKAFLYTILNNLIIDHYRSKKALSLDEMAEQGSDDGEGGGTDFGGRVPDGLKTGGLESEMVRFDSALTSIQVREAVLQLGPVDQRLITLRFLNEESIAQVAEHMGMTENAVYVRSHRALKQLKKFLENQNENI
jgi:RNA polymerase sigma-70 factor, ECF subfamily